MAVGYGTAGTAVFSSNNGTSVAPAYPASVASGDMCLLYVGCHPDTTTVTTPSGWTHLGTFTGGAGSQAAGTGPTKIAAFGRVAASALSGTVTVTISGNSVSWGYIERWTKAAGETWDIAITGGADTAAGTAYSVVTSSVAAGFIANSGDGVSVVSVFPTGTLPTWSAASTVTAQGGGTVTPGTITQRAAPSSTVGNDIGGRVASFLPTASDQAAGTLTYANTLSGTTTAAYGAFALVRLRAITAPTTPTSAPTVAAGADKVIVTTPATLQGGATEYWIYRNGSLLQAGMAANTAFNDDFASVTSTQTYTVTGVNAAGQSAQGPASSAVAADPSPPAGLTLTPDDGQVTVAWTAKSYTATYKVYRGLAGGSRSLVHTSASGASSWVDTGVTNGTAYDYTVSTNVTAPTTRESSQSSVASVTPNPPPLGPVTIPWTGTPGSGDEFGNAVITYPSNVDAGDWPILILWDKDFDDTGEPPVPPAPTGFTQIGTGVGASIQSGTSAFLEGRVRITAYKKDVAADGTEDSTTISVPCPVDASVIYGQLFGIRRVSTSHVLEFGYSSGSDTSAGTAVSIATTSDPGVIAGDYILSLLGYNIATGNTSTAEGISIAGVSMGTVTELLDGTTTLGRDLRAVAAGGVASTGPSTGNPTLTATTLNTGTMAAGIALRIRESLGGPALQSAAIARLTGTSTIRALGRAPGSAARAVARLTGSSTLRAIGRTAGSTSRAIVRLSSVSTLRTVGRTPGKPTRAVPRLTGTSVLRTIARTPGTTSKAIARLTGASILRTVGRTPGATSRALARLTGASVVRTVTAVRMPFPLAIPRLVATSTIRALGRTPGTATRALTRLVAASTLRGLTRTPGATSRALARLTGVSTLRTVGRTPGTAARAIPRLVGASVLRLVRAQAPAILRAIPRLVGTSTVRTLGRTPGTTSKPIPRQTGTSTVRTLARTPGTATRALARLVAASTLRGLTRNPGGVARAIPRLVGTSVLRTIIPRIAQIAAIPRLVGTSTVRTLQRTAGKATRSLPRAAGSSVVRTVGRTPGTAPRAVPRLVSTSTLRVLTSAPGSTTRGIVRLVGTSILRVLQALDLSNRRDVDVTFSGPVSGWDILGPAASTSVVSGPVSLTVTISGPVGGTLGVQGPTPAATSVTGPRS